MNDCDLAESLLHTCGIRLGGPPPPCHLFPAPIADYNPQNHPWIARARRNLALSLLILITSLPWLQKRNYRGGSPIADSVESEITIPISAVGHIFPGRKCDSDPPNSGSAVTTAICSGSVKDVLFIRNSRSCRQLPGGHAPRVDGFVTRPGSPMAGRIGYAQ